MNILIKKCPLTVRKGRLSLPGSLEAKKLLDSTASPRLVQSRLEMGNLKNSSPTDTVTSEIPHPRPNSVSRKTKKKALNYPSVSSFFN